MKKEVKRSNDSKKQTIWIISFVIVGVILLLIIGYLLFFGNDKIDYTKGRCTDREAYMLDDEQEEKIVSIFKEIEEVESVEVFHNVCTVKTIVRLNKDVDVEVLKEKATNMLTVLDDGQKDYFDYSLYFVSNEESETFPINVIKNKNRSDFAW